MKMGAVELQLPFFMMFNYILFSREIVAAVKNREIIGMCPCQFHGGILIVRITLVRIGLMQLNLVDQ